MQPNTYYHRLCRFCAVAGILFCLSSLASARSQELPNRPDTLELLPETTRGLSQLTDIGEFVHKLQQNSFGQMMQSDSFAPLLSSLYENAATQYESMREAVGLSLDEIQSLPSGEITVAFIAPRRKKSRLPRSYKN